MKEPVGKRNGHGREGAVRAAARRAGRAGVHDKNGVDRAHRDTGWKAGREVRSRAPGCIVLQRLDTYQEGRTEDTYWVRADQICAVNIKQELVHNRKAPDHVCTVLLSSGAKIDVDEESARRTIRLLAEGEADQRGRLRR